MTNNNSNLYFPMPSSSTPPPQLPPNPQKLRKKRSKMIKILLPKPQHCSITKPKPYLAQSHFLHSCPECFKQFGSEKALYGHMRCHPDRDYRGMIRKPNKYQVSAPSTSSSSSLIQHQQQQHGYAPVMSLEDHEVASCLLLLSRTDNCDASCSFECSSCKKVFGSHQALGGHRASHKNVKGCFAINRSCDVFERDYNDNDVANVDENKQEMAMVNSLGHQCSICFRVFPTGQALGGHKRRHWEKGDDASGNFVSDQVNTCGLMDLNLPADNSSSAANFNLDLKLGL